MAEGELESRVITLDTSAIYSHLNRSDSHHLEAKALIENERGPLIIPFPILPELTYLIETRQGQAALDQFLRDVDRGVYLLDCGDRDIPRIRALAARYVDLPLGFADSAVVACAERRGGRVFTYDHRHFPAVAREGSIQIVGMS